MEDFIPIDIDKLQVLIEEDINSVLQEHNGFCNLDIVEDGVNPKIFLSFFGGCKGCSSAFGETLNQIQNFLRTELNMNNLEVINTDTT